MSDAPDPDRLRELEGKIDALRKTQEPGARADEHYSQAQHAWRMVVELVAGLVIGFGIGFGLDALFGTTPVFLVLFILLGFVAGVRTMLRTAREIQEEQVAEATKKTRD